MMGHVSCGSTEVQNERLVFEQNSSDKQREYRISTIGFTKPGNPDPNSLSEFQRLVSDGYQVKDLFYAGGLKIIFEK